MNRAPWGSLKAKLCGMKPGDSFAETQWSRRCVIYCTARRAGINVRINQPGGIRAKGSNGFVVTIVG